MLTLLYIGLALLVAIVVGGVFLLSRIVDDWSRDLTTNFAVTDENSPDPRLHPIQSPLTMAELAALAESTGAKLRGWELHERSDSPEMIELHFVRTTPLMKFKDDIRVVVEPLEGGGSLLTAASRSRVGKGDLGQNPRNLRELLDPLRNAR